jgi:leader peptidase (prepilin peptidase)/N-methyltransferase
MPARYILLMWGLNALWCLLVFSYGACLGSLINVIVYRMPLGLSIVTPPSRCPKCDTRLSWRDNIPVLGWVFLRGKCRYCKAPISPEYPIVEAFVGGLFVLLFVLYYLVPTFGATLVGIDWGAIRPVWYLNPASQTWPTFVVLLILMASLVAMTIVDARTFTIPPPLTTVPFIAALVIHPVHAAVVGLLPYRTGTLRGQPGGWLWAIPTPGALRWDWILAAGGGMLGLGIACLLVRAGLIRRSFDDYADWEDKAKAAAVPPAAGENAEAAPASAPEPLPADIWIMYPHARREMLKELAFLAPCGALMLGGWYLGRNLAGLSFDPVLGITVSDPQSLFAAHGAPLWLVVLAGVCLGYLIGGGVVWLVRILGSLAFGKEAMGLGDVHLMAAVGACLGWIDSVLAFFGAAFVGLFWVLLSTLFSGRLARTMPYGPYLAVSTLLVVLCKPLIKLGLSRLVHGPVDIP